MKALMLKSLSIIICFFFTANSALMPAPLANQTQNAPSNYRPPAAGLYIPEQYGTIECGKNLLPSAENTSKPPIVILIKDAHCNYEAQANISKILETLIRDYKIDLVCVEAAMGLLDTNVFGSQPDAKKIERTIDKYIKKGYLTASEALSLTKRTQLSFAVYGVEDAKLYLENFREFRNTISHRDETGRYIELISSVINHLKYKIFNEKLRAFDQKFADYTDNKISLTDWVEYLQSWAVGKGKRNFNLVAKAIALEKTIDFNKVEQERTKLIKETEKTLVKEELHKLIEKSLLFKLGKISSLEYYSYLNQYIKFYSSINPDPQTVSPAVLLANLQRYIHLIKLQSKIDSDGLFNELEAIENHAREDLYQNQAERALNKTANDIRILKKLYNLNLTRKELHYYKDNKADFLPSQMLSFILVQANANNVPIPAELRDDNFIKGAEQFLKPGEYFYEKALERDAALVNNLVKRMRENNKNNAALVVGGFHSDGIEKILKQRGIDCVVITPKITKTQENCPYIELMLDGKIDIDKIISEIGTQNLGVPVISDTIGRKIFPERLANIKTALAGLGISAEALEHLDGTSDIKIIQDKILSILGVKTVEEVRQRYLSEEKQASASFLLELLKVFFKEDEIDTLKSEKERQIMAPEDKFTKQLTETEKQIAETAVSAVKDGMKADAELIDAGSDTGLKEVLRRQMIYRMEESLNRLEQKDSVYKPLRAARKESVESAISTLLEDAEQLLQIAENKKEAAKLIMFIYFMLLLQDEADIKLPYVPHSIKHTLNVRNEVKSAIDNSPTIKSVLTQAYGQGTGEMLALVTAWLHDIGYSVLMDAQAKAEEIWRGVPGYRTGKGYHARLGVILAETPLLENGDSIMSLMDLIFNLRQKPGNAEGSANALDDIKIAINDHGADKAKIEKDGPLGTGQHKYREAGTRADILNFLVRLADNLDADAANRLYSHQTNPFFLDFLRTLELDQQSPGVIKKEFKKSRPIYEKAYSLYLQKNQGKPEAEADKQAKDDFDVIETNIAVFDKTNFPHFAGMIENHRVIEKDGVLVIEVTLNTSNRLIPKDVLRFQVKRMQESYESLRFEGRKIVIRIHQNVPKPHEESKDNEFIRALEDQIKSNESLKENPQQKRLLEAVLEYARRNPDIISGRSFQGGEEIIRGDFVSQTDIAARSANLTDVYILLEGILEVFTKDTALATLDTPGLFGEMIILTGKRTATVKSKTQGRALVITKDNFKKLLADPQFLVEFTKLVDARLTQQNIIDAPPAEKAAPQGQMKQLGRRDPMNEDIEIGPASRQAEFEEKALTAGDSYEGHKVVYADLGGIAAYNFRSGAGEYIIVINSNLAKDIQEEGKFHEAREIYWMSRGFSQHEAHIIASAEQAQKFSIGGNLTVYHESQLQRILETPGLLKNLINENEKERAKLHHNVLARAVKDGAQINIPQILQYEHNLRARASALLAAKATSRAPSADEKKFSYLGKAYIGGEKDKEFWVDEEGNLWIFRINPYAKEEPYRPLGIQLYYEFIKKYFGSGKNAVAVTLNGKQGTVEKVIFEEDVSGIDWKGLRESEINDVFKQKAVPNFKKKINEGSVSLTNLSEEQIKQILQEMVIDWLFSNHDAHSSNFLIDKNGNIIGIDKEQVFKYFPEDKLDLNFHPNGAGQDYLPVFHFIVALLASRGKLSVELIEDVLKLIEGISDENIVSLIAPFAKAYVKSHPDRFSDAESFIKAFLERKHNLRNDFNRFFKGVNDSMGQISSLYIVNKAVSYPRFNIDLSAINKYYSDFTAKLPAIQLIQDKIAPALRNREAVFNEQSEINRLLAQMYQLTPELLDRLKGTEDNPEAVIAIIEEKFNELLSGIPPDKLITQVNESDLKGIGPDAWQIWDLLKSNGYIDGMGIIQEKFKKLRSQEEMELGRFNYLRAEIFAVLSQPQIEKLQKAKEALVRRVRAPPEKDKRLKALLRLLTSWISRVKQEKSDFHRIYLARDGGFFHLTDNALEHLEGKASEYDAGSTVYHLSRARMQDSYEKMKTVLGRAVRKEAKGDIKEMHRIMRNEFQRLYAEDADFREIVDAVRQELVKLGYDRQNKVLFVDTGFFGTIPYFLKCVLELGRTEDELYDETGEERIQVAIVQPSSIQKFAQALFGFNLELFNQGERDLVEKIAEKYAGPGGEGVGGLLEDIEAHPIRFNEGSNIIEETDPDTQLEVFYEQILAGQMVHAYMERRNGFEETNPEISRLLTTLSMKSDFLEWMKYTTPDFDWTKIYIDAFKPIDYKDIIEPITISKELGIMPIHENIQSPPIFFDAMTGKTISYQFKIYESLLHIPWYIRIQFNKNIPRVIRDIIGLAVRTTQSFLGILKNILNSLKTFLSSLPDQVKKILRFFGFGRPGKAAVVSGVVSEFSELLNNGSFGIGGGKDTLQKALLELSPDEIKWDVLREMWKKGLGVTENFIDEDTFSKYIEDIRIDGTRAFIALYKKMIDELLKQFPKIAEALGISADALDKLDLEELKALYEKASIAAMKELFEQSFKDINKLQIDPQIMESITRSINESMDLRIKEIQIDSALLKETAEIFRNVRLKNPGLWTRITVAANKTITWLKNKLKGFFKEGGESTPRGSARKKMTAGEVELTQDDWETVEPYSSGREAVSRHTTLGNLPYKIVLYNRNSRLGAFFREKGVEDAANILSPDGIVYIFIDDSLADEQGNLTKEGAIALQHEELEIYWKTELKDRKLPDGISVERAAHILAWAQQIAIMGWEGVGDNARFIKDQLDGMNTSQLEDITGADRRIHKELVQAFLSPLLTARQLEIIDNFENAVKVYAAEKISKAHPAESVKGPRSTVKMTGTTVEAQEADIEKTAREIHALAERILGTKIDEQEIIRILQTRPSGSPLITDILRNLSGGSAIGQIIMLGNEISRLPSLNILLGKDALQSGGQIIASILDAVAKEAGIQPAAGETPEQAFRRTLIEMGIINAEAENIFKLLTEDLSNVLNNSQAFDPVTFGEFMSVLQELTGNSEEQLLRAFAGDFLGQQIRDEDLRILKENLSRSTGNAFTETAFKAYLINSAVKIIFAETIDNENVRRAVMSKEKLRNLLDMLSRIAHHDIQGEENLDSPLFNIILRLKIYTALKKGNTPLEITKSDLGQFQAVKDMVGNTDFPGSPSIPAKEDKNGASHVSRFSEANAIAEKMLEFSETLNIDLTVPAIINVPIEKLLPEWNKMAAQLQAGQSIKALEYYQGLSAFFALLKNNPNTRVVLRVSNLTDNLRKTIFTILKEAGINTDRVLVEEEITSIRVLTKAQEELSKLTGILPQNIVFFTGNPQLTGEIERNKEDVQKNIKNNELKIFGIDDASPLPCLLLLGYTAASQSVFDENKVLSETIQSALRALGMDEAEIKDIIEQGSAFIKVNLTRISETLNEFQIRRVTVDIAA